MRTRHHHVPTVLAAAILAYLSAAVAHEALGHGGACLAFGGELRGVASTFCECERAGLSPWAIRFGKAAGTLANLAVGALAFAGLRLNLLPRYLLWLVAAVNLFKGAGYLLVDPALGFGDWTAFVEGLPHVVLWRIGLTALGAVLSWLALKSLLRAAAPWLGSAPAERRHNGRTLMLLPYLVVGGGVMTSVASLNYLEEPMFMLTGALSTLGGTSFLAWMYFLDGEGAPIAETRVVERNDTLLAFGTAGLIVLVAYGRGFTF